MIFNIWSKFLEAAAFVASLCNVQNKDKTISQAKGSNYH